MSSAPEAPESENDEQEGKATDQPQIGEPVIVTDRDGEQHRAVIAELPAETAGQMMIERRGTTISLVDYWRPVTIGFHEPVFGVRFVKGVAPDGTPRTYQQRVLSYPISRVMRLAVAGVDDEQ